MLPSLFVRNFRTFRELHIPQLGRVNLLAGRNNVGKTTVLDGHGDLRAPRRAGLRHHPLVGLLRRLFGAE